MGGAADYSPDHALKFHTAHRRVEIPPPETFLESLGHTAKEILFPDDPLRRLRNQPPRRKAVLGLQYVFPILEWGPKYKLDLFKSDVIAGITIASLAIPQGISYAKLAYLPPVLGLYSSFVPPLIYAVMGSSRDVAVGTVAVGSLLMGTMLNPMVDHIQQPEIYLHLAFTATLFAGIFESALGIFRLGFIVDFLSQAAIVGFMGGAATVVCLQQLKGFLGLDTFTHATDVVAVMRSVFGQTHHWRWQSAVLGLVFLLYLLAARYYSKKSPKLFWVSAMAPLTSVILGSLFAFLTHAETHGVQVIGQLKKGINPISITNFIFDSRYLSGTIKTGIVTGMIALAEGIAVGRSFAMFKNYNIDGNKEMFAFGMMNIVGASTSCYLTAGPFSRSAVNFNAGCKTTVSNIVMAFAVMITLLFLTPLFHYTPLVVLSSIIVSAMIGLFDYEAAIRLWHVDKFDFLVCITAYIGVVFSDIQLGLLLAVGLSVLRILLFVARPRTMSMGNIPDSKIYRSVHQYRNVNTLHGILILEIDSPIYFVNSNYLRERISRWIDDEEDKLKSTNNPQLQYVVLNMTGVGNIDTSGITMLKEVKKVMERRGLKVAVANPNGEVMKKMKRSNLLEEIGQEWVFVSVGEAVGACNYLLHSYKASVGSVESHMLV